MTTLISYFMTFSLQSLVIMALNQRIYILPDTVDYVIQYL